MSEFHQSVKKTSPVFLLSADRSGSTLLQKLLNSYPDLLIWGEHAGILNFFWRSWQVVNKCDWIPEDTPRGDWLLEPERRLRPDHPSAWEGWFSKAS